MFDLWVAGKVAGLISAKVASKVMGVSDKPNKDKTGPTNRPSTSSHHKPGRSYFYPSLKIRKLNEDQLVPGVEPPVRLITALQDGVSKRSDVFLADRYLRDLERDFCEDLDPTVKQNLHSFTFDFKALYDSLNKDLVIESLQEAILECRPYWSPVFCNWILSLVELSMRSSIGVFENS